MRLALPCRRPGHRPVPLVVAAAVVAACVVPIAAAAPASASPPAYGVTTTVSGISNATDVAVDPDLGRAYVTDGSATISVVDTATRTVVESLTADHPAERVTVDPVTHLLYATSHSSFWMDVLDPTGALPTRSVEMPLPGTQAVAVDSAVNRAYAFQSTMQSRIDTSTMQLMDYYVRGPEILTSAAIDRTNHRLYVTGDQGDVYVDDSATGQYLGSLRVGGSPSAAALDPGTGVLYVASSDFATVSVLDTASGSVTATVYVSGPPNSVSVDPSTHRAWMTDDVGTVSVIDGDAVIASVAVGGEPTAIVADPSSDGAFFVDASTGRLKVVEPLATPQLTTSPSAGVVAGGTIRETATLAGGASPSGPLGFALYGPADPTCSGTPLASSSSSAANGTASSDVVVTTAGTYHWSVTYAGDAANAAVSALCTDPVVVGRAVLDHLTVSRQTATITAGGQQTYVVTGFDRFGNSRGKVAAAMDVDGDPSVCVALVCAPRTAGRHTVTATFKGKTGTATLRVLAGPADHLTISPRSSTVTLGASQSYVVTAYDAYGNFVGRVAPTLTLDDDGSCSAATCTPATLGIGTVTATSGAMSVTAVLRAVRPAGTGSTLGW